MRLDVGGGTRLFFDVVGSALAPTDAELVEKPTLLMLHGGPGGDHTSFRPYFDRFADSHQVIYLDHRGQGRSDEHGDPTRWDLDTWADDVVRFCDALDISDPIVFGNSFGGFVTIRYAARHPGHAAALVLSSTQARRFGAISAAWFERLGGIDARRCYESIFVDGTAPSEVWLEYIRLCIPLYNTTASPFGPTRTVWNLEVLDHFTPAFLEMDLRADVEGITRPTLVLVGRQDPMTPLEASEELVGLIPQGLGRLEVFDDCGHGSFRDQPDQTERVLREFLASIPG